MHRSRQCFGVVSVVSLVKPGPAIKPVAYTEKVGAPPHAEAVVTVAAVVDFVMGRAHEAAILLNARNFFR